jgi:hypothetical protein
MAFFIEAPPNTGAEHLQLEVVSHSHSVGSNFSLGWRHIVLTPPKKFRFQFYFGCEPRHRSCAPGHTPVLHFQQVSLEAFFQVQTTLA